MTCDVVFVMVVITGVAIVMVLVVAEHTSMLVVALLMQDWCVVLRSNEPVTPSLRLAGCFTTEHS